MNKSLGRLLWNYSKTMMLLAGLTALFGVVGYALGGKAWAIGALVIVGIMNFGAYWYSDKLVLKAHGAIPVGPEDQPRLYRVVERLAQNAGLPMPAVYIVPDSSPNAFATGRNPKHAAVAVTEGLLRLVSERELAGVLGHELAHVRNRDMLIQTVTATVAGAISMLANILGYSLLFGGGDDDDGMGGLGALAMMILAPMLAMIVQMAISRGREYEADRVGARICQDPGALASALEQLDVYHETQASAVVSPAMQHLYIAQPLSGDSLASLFSTHPPMEERIRRLRRMAVS
ncbi:MAG: zinc metalloprotease HtpX [Deltaproteobacteria bacterium]|nr:zinc metalloprotease HtpX [Deltaproteobacteria bacterium]